MKTTTEKAVKTEKTVKEEKAMKKSTKKATATETVKTIETTAEVKEAPTAEAEQTTLKKYSAFVKNEENKTEVIVKDYATKKAFISDLKANGYKICFVCLDSEYEEASKKYNAILAEKKARAKANYTAKKAVAEVQKKYKKVIDVRENNDNTYTVYFDTLTETEVKIYKRLPKEARAFIDSRTAEEAPIATAPTATEEQTTEAVKTAEAVKEEAEAVKTTEKKSRSRKRKAVKEATVTAETIKSIETTEEVKEEKAMTETVKSIETEAEEIIETIETAEQEEIIETAEQTAEQEAEAVYYPVVKKCIFNIRTVLTAMLIIICCFVGAVGVVGAICYNMTYTAEQEAEEAENRKTATEKRIEKEKHLKEIDTLIEKMENTIELQKKAIARNTNIYNTMRKYGYTTETTAEEQEKTDLFMNKLLSDIGITTEEEATATVETLTEKTADFFN